MGALTQIPNPLDPNFPAQSAFNDDLTKATSINDLTWQQVVSGGTTTVFDPEPGAFGIWRLLRGTTAANRAAMVSRAENAGNGFVSFGDGSAQFEWRVRIPTLSDAANRFGCNVGLGSGNAGTSATPGSSIHFRTIDDEAGGNWQCITRATGAQNIIDSGRGPIAGAWTILGATINADASLVKFFIDGLNVATTNLEIPSYALGVTVGPFFALFGGTGTTDRQFDADWIKFLKAFSPGRYP